jgi:ribosomal protein S18 acetylase RimI-like enzyme
MDTPITTREFRADDYDAAVQLWSRVEGLEIAECDGKDNVARFLRRNLDCSRVAIAEGKIVAVALCGHDGRRGYIYHLAVEPKYQRTGVGRLLVQECLSALRAPGIERAIILVAGDNERGHSFWRRIGWEEIEGVVVMGIDV